MGVRYFTDANDFCEEHPEAVILATSILSLEQVRRGGWRGWLLGTLWSGEAVGVGGGRPVFGCPSEARRPPAPHPAVPPLAPPQVLLSLPVQRLKRSTLFVDVLSVKEFPKRLLLRELPPEVDVLCTHPMFGPDSGGALWLAVGAGAWLAGWALVPGWLAGRCAWLAACARVSSPLPRLAPGCPALPAGKGSWAGLNLQYERVRIGCEPDRQRRCDTLLQVSGQGARACVVVVVVVVGRGAVWRLGGSNTNHWEADTGGSAAQASWAWGARVALCADRFPPARAC